MKQGKKQMQCLDCDKLRAIVGIHQQGFINQKEAAGLMGVSEPIYRRWRKQLEVQMNQQNQ